MRPLPRGPTQIFFHIHVRCMKQAAFRCDRQYGNGAVLSFGHQIGPFHRVDGNIHFFSAGAYMFADIKHRCFIHFPFADHDGAGDRSQRKLGVHPVNSQLICAFLIAFAHEPAAAELPVP